MKKKIALTMISLLALTLALTAPSYVQQSEAQGRYHFKIILAQKNATARLRGNLTIYGDPIWCTDFDLLCDQNFVYKKVITDVQPNDVHFDLWVDWDKKYPDEPWMWERQSYKFDNYTEPVGPLFPFHFQKIHPSGNPEWGEVVVEIKELQYDPHEKWQFTVKQENATVLWYGNLTDKYGAKIPNSDFEVYCEGTQLQCVTVQLPWSFEPYDIHYDLWVWSETGDLLFHVQLHEDIRQFPWTLIIEEYDPYAKQGYLVELELDEVQEHRYVLMGGEMDSAGQLANLAYWSIGDWKLLAGTPFATRAPYLTPLHTSTTDETYGMNITFTQKDPITGIVKLSVPTGSYVGTDHIWWGNDTGQYYRMQILVEEQGSGWIFTGQGKNPILGDVDLVLFNNSTGVYSNKTGVPQLLAGTLDPSHPTYPAAGAGPPLGPRLQKLVGPDGIPGTADDPIGDGTPDPPGSSILYIPATMITQFSADDGKTWAPLFGSPWPMLMTTATASDKVVEAGPAPNNKLVGASTQASGEPWEFIAGLDHPGDKVDWEINGTKHPKCNAYVTYAAAWSVIDAFTALGFLDVLFYMQQKLVREDVVIADINCDEIVDIFDIVICAAAFGAKDEGLGNKVASANFDARADLMPAEGTIDIFDLVRIAGDFGAKLTKDCIIRP